MLLNEFGNGSRRSAGELSDGVGDRYCFSARALIGTDCENAFNDGGRNAVSNAARPRLLWRLIDKPQFLANCGADDLRSLLERRIHRRPTTSAFSACHRRKGMASGRSGAASPPRSLSEDPMKANS